MGYNAPGSPEHEEVLRRAEKYRGMDPRDVLKAMRRGLAEVGIDVDDWERQARGINP